MTGPALLIGLVGLILNGLLGATTSHLAVMVGMVVAWPILALLLHMTGRVLGGRGTYTATFRVTGFAYAGFLLLLFALIPGLAPLAHFVGALWVFLGFWLGVAQAHQLSGWRTLLVPVLYVIVVVVVVVILRALFLGAAVALDSLFVALGL